MAMMRWTKVIKKRPQSNWNSTARAESISWAHRDYKMRLKRASSSPSAFCSSSLSTTQKTVWVPVLSLLESKTRWGISPTHDKRGTITSGGYHSLWSCSYSCPSTGLLSSMHGSPFCTSGRSLTCHMAPLITRYFLQSHHLVYQWLRQQHDERLTESHTVAVCF